MSAQHDLSEALRQSAAGEVFDLGSFEQYADDEIDDDFDPDAERICGACGKPAQGFASVWANGREVWFCHPDEGPSCYVGLG